MLRYITGLVLALTLFPAASFGNAEALVEREDIYANETIRLVIESTVPSGGDPDVSVLTREFNVTAGNTSTRTKIINGTQFSLTRWSYLLSPKKTGELTIPAILVRGELTVPIFIQVSDLPEEIKKQNAEHATIELSVVGDELEPYVQQQIILSVKMLYDDTVTSGEASPIDVENAVVERFRDEQNSTEERDGRLYHVFEQRFVLSAEVSGELTISPLVFSGTLSTSEGLNRKFESSFEERVRRMLEGTPLENDPFFMQENFNLDRGNTGRPFAVESNSLTLNVKPRPTSIESTHWLPAEKVELVDSWAEQLPDIRAGQPVQRSITIRTRGLVASQIPELSLETPTGARMYVEPRSARTPTDSRSINGEREHLITYIADAAGELVVPAVAIDWWDVKLDRAAIAELEAIDLNVLAAPSSVPGVTQDDTTSVTALGTDAESAPSTGDDGSAVVVNNDASSAPAGVESQGWVGQALRQLRVRIGRWLSSATLWAIITIGVACICWLMLVRRADSGRRGDPRNKSSSIAPASVNQRLAALGRSLAERDPQGTCRALLELAKCRWPSAPPQNLAALGQRLRAEGGSGEAVLQLDRHLFSGDDSAWRSNELRQLLSASQWQPQQQRQRQRPETTGLAPLYPTQSMSS